MSRSPAALIAAMSVAVTITACTADSDLKKPGTEHPAAVALRWHECAADIESTFLSKHRCGTLKVPQNRTDPDSPTVDLAVVQVWPVGVEPREGLATGFSANIGDPGAGGGGAAAGATRMRGVFVELASRGTDPSSPTLACPEVDGLAAQAPGLPDDDVALRAHFVDGVTSCAHRLRSTGIEPANFDTTAAAADVEDLRKAMGVDSWWGAGSYGTQSRVLFRYVANFPGRLKAAWLDSPWFPETDDVTGGALGTRSALAELFKACAGDLRCNWRYPDLKAAWERATARAAKNPLTGRGETGDHQMIDVLVDDAKLLRFVRYSLGGEGPGNLTWLPRIISEAANGRLNGHLADLVARDPLFCAGYRPQCLNADGFALGVYLTVLCKEQLPLLDHAALRRAVQGDATYQQVFARSPYAEACQAWDTPNAVAPPNLEPDGTPLLLIPGQFDSFSRPEWSESHSREWTHAWTFTVPNNTHNTLGYDECGLLVRNAWAESPAVAPDPSLCTTRPRLTFR